MRRWYVRDKRSSRLNERCMPPLHQRNVYTREKGSEQGQRESERERERREDGLARSHGRGEMRRYIITRSFSLVKGETVAVALLLD